MSESRIKQTHIDIMTAQNSMLTVPRDRLVLCGHEKPTKFVAWLIGSESDDYLTLDKQEYDRLHHILTEESPWTVLKDSDGMKDVMREFGIE